MTSSEIKCGAPAEFVRLWPGKAPDCVCLPHAMESQAVAAAMSFTLHMMPLLAAQLSCIEVDIAGGCCCVTQDASTTSTR